MSMTPARVLKQIEALDDDFNVFWSRKSPPTKAQIEAAEKALGAKLRDDHRVLVETIGCVAVVAKEAVWPRAKQLDVRPTWQLQFGVEVFGVDPDSTVKALDIVVLARERAPEGSKKLVPFLRRIGDRVSVGYDIHGRLHEWAPGQAATPLSSDDPLALLSGMLTQLVADKERMKKEGQKPVRPANATASGASGWLQRLLEASGERAEIVALLAKEPATMRAEVIDRLLAAASGDEPNDDAIWVLGEFAEEPRVLERLFELAEDEDEDLRDTAISVIGCIESRPAAAVPVLLRALEDESEEVRDGAAAAIKFYARPEAIEPLKQALVAAKRAKDWQMGVLFGNLLEALGASGPGRDDVIDILLAHLELENRYATLPAYRALIAMGSKAYRAIPALERLAAHKDRYLEVLARHALGAITGDVKPHLPHFHSALLVKDAGGAVAAAAKIALRELGQVIPAKVKKSRATR
jgi:HEAT repeat protein